VVGPGVSTFYFDQAGSGFNAGLKTFFTAIAGRVPATVLWTVPNVGDLIDTGTGDIVGTWTDGTQGSVSGSGTAAYMHGVGGRIVWTTNGRTNNRLVKGTTFLVPLTVAQFTTSGDMDPAAAAAIKSAAGTLVSTAGFDMVILTKATDAAAGAAHDIVAWDVPVTPSWLRTRKT